MTFGESISSCYSNYATFSGRASRSEYWFFALYHSIVLVGAILLMPFGIGVVLLILVSVGNFLPSVSVMVRRLHDTDHSGWWYWFILVPLVGPIVVLVWLCTQGTDGANNFGQYSFRGGSVSHPVISPSSAPQRDIAEELGKLAKLRSDGTISEEEFQRLKTKLI